MALKAKLDRYGPVLSASAHPGIAAEYAKILDEAERAFDIERTHGIGSLLNLDHPFIKDQLERDSRFSVKVIPESFVTAAERYRALGQV